MMKKLLLLSSAVFVLSFGANSQSAKTVPSQPGKLSVSYEVSGLKTAGTPTVVVDTLHYYLNKYYFKNAVPTLTNFPFYKSAASTVTNVTHLGVRFDVPAGETVTVTGLEAYARKHPNTANLNIKVHLFLCNLDANGKPILPPVDSVVTTIGSVAINSFVLLGGNFTHTTASSPTIQVATPRVMSSSFAVLARNMSTTSGDTVRFLRTAGATLTNTARPTSEKCSDTDYGYVRYLGQFYSTRNFTLAPGFGVGTDYEFLIAPRVTYAIQASHLASQGILLEADSLVTPDTMCTRGVMTFTNTSSKFFEHRQYNLNQFYRKWNLYSAFAIAPPGGFSSDSSITWSFEFYDIPSKPDSRVFLPYVNNGTITAETDLAYYPACFTDNQFRARLRPMGAFALMPQLVYNEGFKMCLRYCNGDTVGIADTKGYDHLNVYPNPAVNGKTTVSGLSGKNTVVIYNVLGQIVSTEVTEESFIQLDFTKQAKGTYVVRIVNSDNRTKIIKLINQTQN
jgi:hypothetical protein